MESSNGLVNDKKSTNNAKSHYNGPSKIKYEQIKGNSFNINDVVHSLDLAFGRLEKSKLINGEHCKSSPVSPMRIINRNTLGLSSSHLRQGPENSSLISMNFSEYELTRNLSRSNCNSEYAYSGSNCNARLNVSDPAIKSERLERYFQSAEMWSRSSKGAGSNTVHFKIPDDK